MRTSLEIGASPKNSLKVLKARYVNVDGIGVPAHTATRLPSLLDKEKGVRVGGGTLRKAA